MARDSSYRAIFDHSRLKLQAECGNAPEQEAVKAAIQCFMNTDPKYASAPERPCLGRARKNASTDLWGMGPSSKSFK